jgi:ribose transport system ATP-binding protein
LIAEDESRTAFTAADRWVTETFPGARALDNFTFSLLAGEVHGLVGENGAGKSALMAVASDALVPDSRRVVINGKQTLGDTEQAHRLGLAIVRQKPALMPDSTIAATRTPRTW